MTKFTIERLSGRSANTWVNSATFPGYYPQDVAESILDEYPHLDYRMVPVTIKPYRRHAAVTQLELRGAIAMLGGAQRYLTRTASVGPCLGEYEAFAIFNDAMLGVTRQLETL